MLAKMMKAQAVKEEGFTFLELITTISIMGILAAMPIASGIQQSHKANEDVQMVQQHQQTVDDLLAEYGMSDDE